MEKFEKYLDRARNLADDAGGMAKNIAGDVVSGAKEKFQGALKDARAGREIRQGIEQLESFPEFDGSIIFKMELETTINSLSSLLLIINDDRLDNDSIEEEIGKVMNKVQPADPKAEETEEQQAIENVKAIAYRACARALEAVRDR